MNYEAWRATFQSSEQAARAAFREWQVVSSQGEGVGRIEVSPSTPEPIKKYLRETAFETVAELQAAHDALVTVCPASEAVATVNEQQCFSSEDANRMMSLPPGTKLYAGLSIVSAQKHCKFVPVEPTEEMRDAAQAEFERGMIITYQQIYRAMVDAAPAHRQNAGPEHLRETLQNLARGLGNLKQDATDAYGRNYIAAMLKDVEWLLNVNGVCGNE